MGFQICRLHIKLSTLPKRKEGGWGAKRPSYVPFLCSLPAALAPTGTRERTPHSSACAHSARPFLQPAAIALSSPLRAAWGPFFSLFLPVQTGPPSSRRSGAFQDTKGKAALGTSSNPLTQLILFPPRRLSSASAEQRWGCSTFMMAPTCAVPRNSDFSGSTQLKSQTYLLSGLTTPCSPPTFKASGPESINALSA